MARFALAPQWESICGWVFLLACGVRFTEICGFVGWVEQGETQHTLQRIANPQSKIQNPKSE